MSATAGRVPRLVLVSIQGSSNWSLSHRAYESLDDADAAVTRAFASYASLDPTRSDTISVFLRWDDWHIVEEHLRFSPAHVAAAASAGIGLLRYLLLASAKAAVAGSIGLDLAPYVVEQRRHRGRELLRRLLADAAARRNAGGVPRVERVEITAADNRRAHRGVYASIAEADAMLERAYGAVPPPSRRPFHVLEADVVWTDGYYLRPRVFIDQQFLRDAKADGGILRHALLRAARSRAAPETYPGARPDVIAQHTGAGRAVLARIEADALDEEARRNAATSEWTSPTLLPDPAAAIRRLRDRFVDRRRVVEARGEADDGEPGNGAAYPATNHADVRYTSNYIAAALRHDLRAFDEVTHGVIWNHWCAVRDTIETLLRGGASTDEYRDNEGFWTRQLPALAQLLDDALAAQRAPRNGRLTFRPVGRRGEAYPAWVADLRGRSGVYVIRAPGETGELEVVYVGSSSADRLHETLTRHFQTWRRWKGFWRGQYGEGHDPGLTYDRDTAEAAVIVTPPRHAYEMEMRLIRRLRPRDNLVGQAGAEDWYAPKDASRTAEAVPF